MVLEKERRSKKGRVEERWEDEGSGVESKKKNKEREERVINEEREREGIKKKFSTFVHTVPKMEWHSLPVSKFIGFIAPRGKSFLVFGVSNIKYLAFDTPNENVLLLFLYHNNLLYFYILKGFKKLVMTLKNVKNTSNLIT